MEGDRKECRICNNLVGRTNYARHVRSVNRGITCKKREQHKGGDQIRLMHRLQENTYLKENDVHILRSKCYSYKFSKAPKIESLHGLGSVTQ